MSPVKGVYASVQEQMAEVTRAFESIKPDLGVVNCPAVG